MSYKINREFQLGINEGDSRVANRMYIIAHETANPTATGRNEATYMKRNWRNAYTTDIVGDGIDYRIGEWGYVSYGALDANPDAPVQIELQHTSDPALFKKNYAVYIELIREAAKTYGIPLTLDSGGRGTKGVKSHKWVSDHIGGDHQDPYSYLTSMGVSKAQFAHDIANGIGKVVSQPAKPAAKPASKPAASKLSNKSFANGTKVKFLARASAYQTGEKIPAWVKKGTYTVQQRKTVNKSESVYAFLLKEIQSWVYSQDLEAVSAPKPKPASKPAASKLPSGLTKEHGTFINGDTPIQVRKGSAGVNATKAGMLPAYASIIYDGWIAKDGYTWIHYVGYSGDQLYCPVRHNGVAWGTFK